MEWMKKKRYLRFNPFDDFTLSADEKEGKRPQRNRALSRALWDYLEQYLETLPLDVEGIRARFLFLLAYATGMRRGELARARIRMLAPIEDEDSLDDAWALEVIGQGGKKRVVPIQRKVMLALEQYLVARG